MEELYSWIRRVYMVMMSILPRLIYTFNTTLVKLPAKIWVDIDKLIIKFIWKDKGQND